MCERFRVSARILTRPEPGSALPSARKLRRLGAELSATVRRLRRLTPPRGDEDEIDRYLDGLQINARRSRRLATAVASNRRKRADAAYARLAAGTGATRALARAYGFGACAEI